MSAIQDSLDRLLHVITNANDNERIVVFYLVECNSVDELGSECGDVLLHVAAARGTVIISTATRSDYNVHDPTNKSLIELRDKTYEFLRGIYKLYAASRSITRSLDVTDLFLDIIHRECRNDSQMTAEKLVSLQYPLWQAVRLGNAEVIEHMIIRGCPVDDCHPDKKFTALSKAVQRMHLEVVRALIKRDADVDLVDASGRLPIAYYDPWYRSIQQPEIIKILLANSKLLRVFPQENLLRQFKGVLRHGTKEIIQMVIEYRHDVLNIRDNQGMTILHYLANNCHSDIFELLHGRKIDVNASDAAGRTPLFMAASNPLSHINIFTFLLETKADVNARTETEYVPLFALCHHNYHFTRNEERYFKIIEMFLQHDVDIQFVGFNQTTVFDIINDYKSFCMAEPLLAHLAVLEEQGNPVKELIRDKINSSQMFKNYFELCKSELVNIKNNSNDQGLTLHAILVNCEEQIFKIYKSHGNSISKLESLKEQCCPDHAYYCTIKKRICSIAKRIELYRKAAPVVCKLTKLGIAVNHLVIIGIMDYLDDQDFYNLINVTKIESILA